MIEPKREESAQKSAIKIMQFVPILILLLVSFAVYFNTLYNGFVYDDNGQIVENPWIKNVKHLPDIFSKGVWSFQAAPSMANYYRPLMHFIALVNYHAFGLKPWGFHLANILFHAGNTLLVFIITSKLFGVSSSKPAAAATQGSATASIQLPFIAALLFAVHPIHTEAVAWVAAVPELSYTFFFLLSFYFYIVPRPELKNGYIFSVVSFFLALLCKETALSLLIILLVYDYALSKKRVPFSVQLKIYVPYFIVAVVYLILRFNALRSLAPIMPYGKLMSYEYIINIFPLFTLYLGKLIFPINLNAFIIYHPIESLIEVKGMLCLLATVTYAFLSVVAYRKNKAAFFSLLLIAIPLIPTFIVPAFSQASLSERYLYLPSVGFVVLPAMLLAHLREKMPRYGIGVIVTVTMLVGFYSVQTIKRNAVWKDDLTLFADTVKKSPDGETPRGMLGIALMKAGRYDEAIEEFRNTLKLNPDSANGYYNLGLTFFKKGEPQEAIPDFQKALTRTPNDADAHRYLAASYAMVGRMDEAIEQYGILNVFNPNSPESYINLGIDLEKKGLVNEAIATYKKALALAPDNADVHYALLNAYIKSGQVDRAIERYREEVRLKPANALYRNLLGVAYAKQGVYDKAIEQFKIAVQLAPTEPAYRRNLDIASGLKNSAGRKK